MSSRITFSNSGPQHIFSRHLVLFGSGSRFLSPAQLPTRLFFVRLKMTEALQRVDVLFVFVVDSRQKFGGTRNQALNPLVFIQTAATFFPFEARAHRVPFLTQKTLYEHTRGAWCYFLAPRVRRA